MSEERADDAADTEQGGVFGKLPASRPGTRSPRRGDGAKATAKKTQGTAATPKRKPPATPRSRPAPRRTPQPPPAAREPVGSGQPEDEQRGSLDDLAWAGVAAVAEAATLGVRLANRALGALRDNVDRR